MVSSLFAYAHIHPNQALSERGLNLFGFNVPVSGDNGNPDENWISIAVIVVMHLVLFWACAAPA